MKRFCGGSLRSLAFLLIPSSADNFVCSSVRKTFRVKDTRKDKKVSIKKQEEATKTV